MEENTQITPPSYDEMIRNISDDQKTILHNILELHCPETSRNENGQLYYEMDFTYSEGKYYTPCKGDNATIPQPKYKLDVFPQAADIIKIEPLGPLPFDDNSIESINCDLPFVISVGPSMGNGNDKSNIISNRFASYYPRENMFESYHHWITEAYRVLKPGGILAFKCQGTVSSALNLLTPEFSWLMATSCGFYPKDQFFLQAKARLHSGKIKQQQHARKFTSTFWVFEKSIKKRDLRYFKWMSNEQKENFINNFKTQIMVI